MVHKSKKGATEAFMTSLTLSFSQYPIGYTSQPYSVWEKMIHEYDYQETGVTGGHF